MSLSRFAQRPTSAGLLVAAGLLLAAGSGCTGHSRLEFIPLSCRTVEPPPARTTALRAGRCYWWQDEYGQVWVAMEHENRSALGRYASFALRLSLVLDKLPAGRARDYTLTRRSFRGVFRSPTGESRFISTAGAATLQSPSGNRLRGSFRLLGQRQASRVLGDWGPPSSYLIQGTFEAVRDEVRGGRILADTESQGWGRQARSVLTTTGPATATSPATTRSADEAGSLDGDDCRE